MFSLRLLPLVLAIPALARPSPSPLVPECSGCDISHAKVDVPAGQTIMVPPTLSVSFLAIGVGVQNYTCSSAGNYTSTGAVAELFDISCLYRETSLFNQVSDIAMAAWSQSSVQKPSQLTFREFQNPEILGEHYFITNPVTGTGISPKWDFTSRAFKSNPQAFVVAAKSGDIPAPTGAKDVDWLSLTAMTGQGSLANQVFRTDTRGGQPPTSCTPGAQVSVKYVAKYCKYPFVEL
ncbi:hypothetical protein C8J56DRAFT_1003476 [Mycena floridula]|nr:hypothetical protein C8J56DRAFT_1003476 [Mycena floridula]